MATVTGVRDRTGRPAVAYTRLVLHPDPHADPARRAPQHRDLEAAIYRYIDHHNVDPQPFIWTKTADEILANVARFCKRTSESGH